MQNAVMNADKLIVKKIDVFHRERRL